MTLHNRWHTEQRVPDGEDSRERGRKGRGDGRALNPPRRTNRNLVKNGDFEEGPVELLAGREGAVAQVVRTVPGRRYALSFTVGDAGNACRGSLVVEAYAGRESVKVAYESEGKGGARRAVLPFRAAAARTRIVFFSSFYSKCEVIAMEAIA
nr:uncharacterized protein LOC117856225 [Setaria viridis]